MKKKITAMLLTAVLLFSMCGCFPTLENNASTANIDDLDTITIEQLGDVQKHISEQPFENFTVDADVLIEVRNNFNTYTATSYQYDLEAMKNYFLKDKEIVNSSDEDHYKFLSATDGSFVSLTKLPSGLRMANYRTKEYSSREIEYLFTDSSGVRWDKHIKFATKELDFMSISEAVELADNAVKALGVEAGDFMVYSIDIAAINELSKEAKERNGDWYEMLNYTKNDEFYLIVPQILLPNGSTLGEADFILADEFLTEIYSSLIYVTVGKNGILNVQSSGVYSVTQEQAGADKIVSFDYAYKKIKEEYNVALRTNITVHKIVLTYVPFKVSGQEGVFELKPAWIFYMTDGTLSLCERIVDATTGNVVFSVNAFLD